MALTLFYPSPITSYFCSSFHAINNRIPILFHLINKNKTYVSLTNGYNSIPGIIGGALVLLYPSPSLSQDYSFHILSLVLCLLDQSIVFSPAVFPELLFHA